MSVSIPMDDLEMGSSTGRSREPSQEKANLSIFWKYAGAGAIIFVVGVLAWIAHSRSGRRLCREVHDTGHLGFRFNWCVFKELCCSCGLFGCECSCANECLDKGRQSYEMKAEENGVNPQDICHCVNGFSCHDGFILGGHIGCLGVGCSFSLLHFFTDIGRCFTSCAGYECRKKNTCNIIEDTCCDNFETKEHEGKACCSRPEICYVGYERPAKSFWFVNRDGTNLNKDELTEMTGQLENPEQYFTVREEESGVIVLVNGKCKKDVENFLDNGCKLTKDGGSLPLALPRVRNPSC